MDNINQTYGKSGVPDLPGATTSLVLGILSISMCYCWGTVGLILSIIGLTLGNRAVAIYKANPGVYADVSYKNANSGKICSIIGLVLSALSLFYTIVTWSATMQAFKNAMNLLG